MVAQDEKNHVNYYLSEDGYRRIDRRANTCDRHDELHDMMREMTKDYGKRLEEMEKQTYGATITTKNICRKMDELGGWIKWIIAITVANLASVVIMLLDKLL